MKKSEKKIKTLDEIKCAECGGKKALFVKETFIDGVVIKKEFICVYCHPQMREWKP